jgi:hypothetical protein
MKGELQLTAAERQEKIDKKRKEIVNYIHKYYIDPKTKLPHPVVRIEGAIDEIKVSSFHPNVVFFVFSNLPYITHSTVLTLKHLLINKFKKL